MQDDLLNEDDFINKTSHHNPRKSFGMFYFISFVQLIALITIAGFLPIDPMILGFVYIAIIFVMPFIMVFYGKNSYAHLQTIAVGIMVQLAIYYFPLIIFAIFMDTPSDEIVTCIIIFTANYIFCAGITLSIVYRKQKRLNIDS